MRDIIGLVIGLYLTVALVVAGGGVYGFLSGEASRPAACEPSDLRVDAGLQPGLAGGPNWMLYVAWRAIIWPKAYFDEQYKSEGIVDWLVVGYDPFDDACR